jgi:hypothetical protein
MTYKTEVLNWSNERHSASEKMNKILKDLKKQLDSAVPIQFLMQGMMESGVEEEIATRLLMEATNYSVAKCPNCGLGYSGSLSYCQECGSKLSAIK